MTTAIKQHVTVEEFERVEEKARLDLIRGELHPMPPMPGEEHGAVTSDLSLELCLFVRDNKLGQCYAAETRFIIERDPDTAIGPDWAFVARERLPARRSRGFAPFAPDAVLEVRSPSDSKKQAQEKIERWLASGVRWALELNPATQLLTVYRPGHAPRELTRDDVLTGDDVLPGLNLLLRPLFEREFEQEDNE